MTEENKKRGLPKYENPPPPPPKRKVKTPEQIAKSFVDEMQEYGLSYEQMLEVIALAKVKLSLLKEDFKLKHPLDVKTIENPSFLFGYDIDGEGGYHVKIKE